MRARSDVPPNTPRTVRGLLFTYACIPIMSVLPHKLCAKDSERAIPLPSMGPGAVPTINSACHTKFRSPEKNIASVSPCLMPMSIKALPWLQKVGQNVSGFATAYCLARNAAWPEIGSLYLNDTAGNRAIVMDSAKPSARNKANKHQSAAVLILLNDSYPVAGRYGTAAADDDLAIAVDRPADRRHVAVRRYYRYIDAPGYVL